MIDNQAVKDVVYLASCAVNKRIPDLSRIEETDPAAVLALAKRHMLAATVSVALESAGCKNQQTNGAVAAAQRKAILLDAALKNVKEALTKREIWFMPLKGAILKDYYPKYGMREFSDYDVLVDPTRAADVKDVMEELGFTTVSFNRGNHDVYRKGPSVTFEMHTALFSGLHDEDFYNYYQNVEERLVGEGYDRRFTPEDFYLYHVAHEYKHYVTLGSGLRFLLDVYVFLKNVELDEDYVATESQKLGVREFERENRALAFRLFDGEELTDADCEIIEYRLESGASGTRLHLVENKIREKKWGKLRYAFGRFLVPIDKTKPRYAVFSKKYPFFYRHKVLLPLLPFYRLFNSLRKGRFVKEVKNIWIARSSRRSPR